MKLDLIKYGDGIKYLCLNRSQTCQVQSNTWYTSKINLAQSCFVSEVTEILFVILRICRIGLCLERNPNEILAAFYVGQLVGCQLVGQFYAKLVFLRVFQMRITN